MPYFNYGSKEIDYLKSVDKRLAIAIEDIGFIKRQVNPDVFSALVQSIISQQISTKAALTVSKRLQALVGGFTPQRLLDVDLTAIQQCGMSHRKAAYIKGVAEAAMERTVDFSTLHLLPDEVFIKTLCALKGVGVWTAEMLLVFSLCRLDVVSYSDLAIRRGIMNLYGLATLSRDIFEQYKRRYSPYGSVASLYLWELS